MIEFNAFHDLLLPELPRCTVPMVNLQLLHTAREFCQSTSAWTSAFDDLALLPGVTTYELFPVELEAETVRLSSLRSATELLWQDRDREAKEIGQTNAHYRSNEPPFSLSSDLLSITLAAHQAPTAAGVLTLTGIVKPALNALTLPDLLMSQYSDAMRFGVLARLMEMGKKPWTDRELAAKYFADWRQAVSFAAYQVQVGNTRAPLRVRSYG